MRDAEVQILNRHGFFGRFGNAWAEHTTRETRQQLRRMCGGLNLGGATASTNQTQGDVQAYQPEWVENYTVNVDPSRVLNVEGDIAPQLPGLQGNPDDWVGVYTYPSAIAHPDWNALFSDGALWGSEMQQVLFWPVGGSGMGFLVGDGADNWILPLEDPITVTRIERKDGSWMLRGVEFQSMQGVILFHDDPTQLLPRQYASASGFRARTAVYEYTLGMDGLQVPGKWIIRYARESGGALSFKRALAEMSGLVVWEEDTHIMAAAEVAVGYTYWTPHREVRAWYPHTPLSVGQWVQEGDVVADAGSFDATYAGETLTITLSQNLFQGALSTRALRFISEHKPLAVPHQVAWV